MDMPPLLEVADIRARLQLVFAKGSPRRNYCVREMAARTVFVMLYVGAIEGTDMWMGPKHVVRMGNSQASDWSSGSRMAYARAVARPGSTPPPDRWYQDNTREPIRDETLKEGLVQCGAVVTKAGIATTSSKPRYALQAGFAALFDPALADDALQDAVCSWQDNHLSVSGLARVRLRGRAAAAIGSKVLVTLPNGEARQMEAGPSSVITKSVVEVFTKRFLSNPAVLWISESGNKVVQRDDDLAAELGIVIQGDRLLPDLIVVDIEPTPPLIVFIEVVATDGPITEARRTALLAMVTSAGFSVAQVAFVSAFEDRDSTAFRKAVADLAWGSFAWCMAEPDHLIILDGKEPATAGSMGVLNR